MQRLDPKYVWIYYIQSLVGLVVLIIIFIALLAPILFRYSNDPSMASTKTALTIGFFIWIGIGIFIFIGNFIWAKLAYKYYLYELREDGLRIERGVIWKKYVTIPYERIQNVDIYRGLVARIFRLSDLYIQTAGMSGGTGSEGRLPGLSPQIAEQLRDELIKRTRGKQQTPIVAPAPNQGV